MIQNVGLPFIEMRLSVKTQKKRRNFGSDASTMNLVLRSLLSMAGGEKDPHLVDRMSAFKGYVFHIDQSSNTLSTSLPPKAMDVIRTTGPIDSMTRPLFLLPPPIGSESKQQVVLSLHIDPFSFYPLSMTGIIDH